ncbi:hypothetical protein L873DRAFT_1798447 [Choiromyces venosus 120613-1]|uniref:Origin recognition complex subunit 1 n=1 Tax=Choiromyces venosus 120613-1 TaxID=1336337 RepID=A0A3N4K372_9PEZI|nr:hypothetical protein L873DRAFT_1798447 [Choiromyces venosus 120613-1]
MNMIQSCLEGVSSNIVDPEAIQFASRQVAAASRDARRSLDICCRAFEIVEHSSNKDTDDNEPPYSTTGSGLKACGRVTIAVVKQVVQ